MRPLRALLPAVVVGIVLPAGLAGQQHLSADMPPELFQMNQLYVLSPGVFHTFANGSAMPLVGDGGTAYPLVVGARIGAPRSVQVELEVRDRFGTGTQDAPTDPLDPFQELPPDTANDVRARGGIRIGLPAAPLELISVSGSLISSLRGDETVLLELSAGVGHRVGESGPVLLGEVLHRRGIGEDVEGGDIKSTSVSGAGLVERGGVYWSLEAALQVNEGEQPNAGGITPAAYWQGPLSLGIGVPIRFSDGVRAGLSLSVGLTLDLDD